MEFIESYWKFGYWYLLVLFEFHAVYFICDTIIQLLKNKVWIEIILYVLVYIFFRFITRFIPVYFNLITDYFQFIDYLPYFLLGIIVKQTPVIIFIKRHFAIVFTIFVSISVAAYAMWDNEIMLSTTTILLRIALIITILMIFMAFDTHKEDGIFKRCTNEMFATIGRHTLSIYMIQYFFFRYINLQSVGQELYNSHNYITLLSLVTIVALFLCYFCIAIEKIISLSTVFSTIFWGKKICQH